MDALFSRLSYRQSLLVVGVFGFFVGILGISVVILSPREALGAVMSAVPVVIGSLKQPANTIVLIIDVVISAALTYLIYRTYRRQNDILNTQSKIFEAAHRPSLRAHDEPEVTNTHPINKDMVDEEMMNPEYVTVRLENTGNDVAENLQLHCLISCDGADDSVFKPIPNDLQLVAEDARQVSGDSSLRPEDNEKTFYANTKIADYIDDSKKENPLGILLKDLADDDKHEEIDTIRFGFAVTYESTLDRDTVNETPTHNSVYLRPAWKLPSTEELDNNSASEACERSEDYEIEFLRERVQNPLKFHD